MNTIRFAAHQVAAFALAAVMTFGVLAGLGSVADTSVADAQQLACTIAAPRA